MNDYYYVKVASPEEQSVSTKKTQTVGMSENPKIEYTALTGILAEQFSNTKIEIDGDFDRIFAEIKEENERKLKERKILQSSLREKFQQRKAEYSNTPNTAARKREETQPQIIRPQANEPVIKKMTGANLSSKSSDYREKVMKNKNNSSGRWQGL